MEKVLFRYEGDRSLRKEYFEVESKLRRKRTAGAQWRAKLERLPHSFLMTSNVLCVNLKGVPLLGRLQNVLCLLRCTKKYSTHVPVGFVCLSGFE